MGGCHRTCSTGKGDAILKSLAVGSLAGRGHCHSKVTMSDMLGAEDRARGDNCKDEGEWLSEALGKKV